MKLDSRPLRRGAPDAIAESLAALFGRFEAAPLPEGLASLVDQLEAAYPQRAPEPQGAEG